MIYFLEKEFKNLCQVYLEDKMDDKKVPKSTEKFRCQYCDYTTSRFSHLERHAKTIKHQGLQMDDVWMTKKYQKVPSTLALNMVTNLENHDEKCQKSTAPYYVCNCGKKYKYRQGLWKHQKMCQVKESENVKIEPDDIINVLMQQNNEFKQLLVEQNNKIIELAKEKNNMIVTQTNNTTTNNFNLQLFLNVECKDAININEFIDSIEVDFDDLEETGQIGYVDGVSKIFIRELNDLDVHNRPIHCSDIKRQILHIKNNNVWEKENDNRDNLKKVIGMITTKNIKKIIEWQKENPEYNNPLSKVNDKYQRILGNIMNGLTAEESQKNYDKIISKIAKEVTIDKKSMIKLKSE